MWLFQISDYTSLMFERELMSVRDKLCGSTTRIEHEILYQFFEFHNYFSENHRPTSYPHGEYWECKEKNNARKRDDMQAEVRRRDYTCKRGQEIWMVSRERKNTIKTSEEQEGDLGARTEKACKTEAYTCAQQRWQVYVHERERERLMHTREREPRNAQG